MLGCMIKYHMDIVSCMKYIITQMRAKRRGKGILEGTRCLDAPVTSAADAKFSEDGGEFQEVSAIIDFNEL